MIMLLIVDNRLPYSDITVNLDFTKSPSLEAEPKPRIDYATDIVSTTERNSPG